jgi:hypothetical protein
MTNTYRINAGFAVSKAKEAVASWAEALEQQRAKGNLEGIRFCEESLKACEANLEAVRRDVRDNWTMYL